MPRKKPRVKHRPQRTCVACGDKQDKIALSRLVRTPDEGVVYDPSGKRNGRGAYVCDRQECWERLIRGPILETALNTTISPSEREALAQHQPAGSAAAIEPRDIYE